MSGQNEKRNISVGLLAHVDAGKTTLSEAMLYLTGAVRKLGRVDHGDAFLDTDAQERRRGITIFAKQAILELPELNITLLDTPGHVDFSGEMERTLQVLDCAVLVISGTDGVQAHTRTLWKLLEHYHVPTFLFINKIDLHSVQRHDLLARLQAQLSESCVDFCRPDEEIHESIAMCGEEALESFLAHGSVSQETVRRLVAQRQLFPCWFGSALKLEGVEALLQGLAAYAPQPEYPQTFGARVFKISRDSRGDRLTWLKVTGGTLRAKMLLRGGDEAHPWEEKVDQLRLYRGSKYQMVEQARAGSVVALTGLSHTYPGQGLGEEKQDRCSILEPVLNYRLVLPDDVDPHTVLPKLRQLEEEDPLLRIVWNERWQEIHVRLMGPVQCEVLQQLMLERFSLPVSFDTGSIVYKETIAQSVLGCGHFEPLRHYAEVHLLLEPGERGSGIQVASTCSVDALELNWQRLILSHLTECAHPGVLTGSPLTDVKITLTAGRAHLKHTEGGDFRQATWRALRQGLMSAQSLLLEPWYDFRLLLPQSCVGRAMTDVQNMGGQLEDPRQEGEMTLLCGSGPVAQLQNYWQDVAVYSHGLGQLSCSLRGYEPCRSSEDVIAAIGYEPERDVDHPADSVFCSHGSPVTVNWREAPEHMHVSPGICLNAAAEPSSTAPARRTAGRTSASDDELQAIFERTYGKSERRDFRPPVKVTHTRLKDSYHIHDPADGADYLLVDGYNIIFAWEELKALSQVDLAAARSALEDILADYRGFHRCEVILVFDAYKVKRNPGSVEQRNGIHVVYTKEAETADMYIEKTSYRLQKEHRVRVATSDGLEQLIVLGHGALRLSAEAFHAEVEATRGRIAELVRQSNARNRGENRARLKP